MIKYNLQDFVGGWFVGDFNPSIEKSQNFEVCIKRYTKGDYDHKHYHLLSDEITVIVSGSARMNDTIYQANDIIQINKGESTDFEALEDCVTCVVKIPSSKNDKYLVD
jgi:hypothetical protein